MVWHRGSCGQSIAFPLQLPGTGAGLGQCASAGWVLPKEPPLLEESWEDPPCLWRHTSLNLNLRTRAISFLCKVYFLIPLIHNCSAQRYSKTRRCLQELGKDTELWCGTVGNAHIFLTLFKAMSANLTEKRELEVQRAKELGREFFSFMGKVSLQLH